MNNNLFKIIKEIFHAPNKVSNDFAEKNLHCPVCGIALTQKRWDLQTEILANEIKELAKLNTAELLDIIADFQEGHNTNLHCLELARCISNNTDKILYF